MENKTTDAPAFTSDQINKVIRELEDDDRFEVRGLEGSGKKVPCIGWYWRDVDFDDTFVLGKIEKIKYPGMPMNPLQSMMEAAEPPGFVGFMENNKWGYREQYIKKDTPEWKAIREKMVYTLVFNTLEAFQDLFDTIQAVWMECSPEEQEANHSGLEGYSSCARCGWDRRTDYMDNVDPERFVGIEA